MKILKITVTDTVKIENNEDIGSGSVNTVQCVFSLPETFNGLTVVASFKKNDDIYNKAIVDNICYVPHEVLEESGYVYLGVYAYQSTDSGLVLRESPLMSGFTVYTGSYMGEGKDTEIIEPSELEMQLESMNKIKYEAKAIVDDFSAEDVLFKDGDTFQEKYDKGQLNGPQGPKGDKGDKGEQGAQGIPGKNGYTPVRGTDYWTNEDINLIKEYCDECLKTQITDVIGGEY